MRIYTILLALLGLAVMETTTQNSVQAAVPHSCCTSYSRASAVKTLVGRKAVVRCVQQDITGPCNTKALILVTRKGDRVCVNPRARKIHPLLKKICTGSQSRRDRKRPKQRKHRV